MKNQKNSNQISNMLLQTKAASTEQYFTYNGKNVLEPLKPVFPVSETIKEFIKSEFAALQTEK